MKEESGKNQRQPNVIHIKCSLNRPQNTNFVVIDEIKEKLTYTHIILIGDTIVLNIYP